MSPLMSNLFHIVRTTFFGPKKLDHNISYYQATVPQEKKFGRKFREGDLWFDISDHHRLYVWNGRRWVPAGGELVG